MPNLEDQITAMVLAIFRANGKLMEWGDQFAAGFGLTSARWQVLGAIAMSTSPLPAPKIAASMGVTRQGTQKQLNLLLEDGLVEQLPNPSNTRSPLYRLSKPGQDQYQAIEAHWKKHARALGRQLSPLDIEAAQNVLIRIAELHTQASAEDPS